MRIGEFAEAAGTTAKTLRFYEEQGLLPPPDRTSSGYRDYPPDAIPCAHVRDLLDARLRDIEQQIAQLTALRDTIANLRDDAAHPEPETCSADQVCRYV